MLTLCCVAWVIVRGVKRSHLLIEMFWRIWGQARAPVLVSTKGEDPSCSTHCRQSHKSCQGSPKETLMFLCLASPSGGVRWAEANTLNFRVLNSSFDKLLINYTISPLERLILSLAVRMTSSSSDSISETHKQFQYDDQTGKARSIVVLCHLFATTTLRPSRCIHYWRFVRFKNSLQEQTIRCCQSMVSNE